MGEGERKSNTRFRYLVAVVPDKKMATIALPDCAPRPQDGTGAFKKCVRERERERERERDNTLEVPLCRRPPP